MTRRIYCRADLNRAATMLRLARLWDRYRIPVVIAAVVLAYGIAGYIEHT